MVNFWYFFWHKSNHQHKRRAENRRVHRIEFDRHAETNSVKNKIISFTDVSQTTHTQSTSNRITHTLTRRKSERKQNQNEERDSQSHTLCITHGNQVLCNGTKTDRIHNDSIAIRLHCDRYYRWIHGRVSNNNNLSNNHDHNHNHNHFQHHHLLNGCCGQA